MRKNMDSMLWVMMFLGAFLPLAFIPLQSKAFNVQIDGIHYDLRIESLEAEVISGGYSGDLVIPSSVKYNGIDFVVTSIESFVCRDDSFLVSVTIPNSVKAIGHDAFAGCTKLKTVVLSNSLSKLESSIFFGCSSLTSVTIPNSVTFIDSSVFVDCTSLTSVNIPNSVTYIGYMAFSGCTSLPEITLPNSLTAISDGTFLGCKNLSSVKIPDSVLSIKSRAFEETAWYDNQPYGLVYAGKVAYKYKEKENNYTDGFNVEIKEGTLGIAEEAFEGIGVTSVSIPSSMKIIENRAFFGTNLISVVIPEGVEYIGINAFVTYGLKYVTINGATYVADASFIDIDEEWYENLPDGIIYAGKIVLGYKGEMPFGTEIVIEDGTLGIAERAFSDCKGMTSITIPNSVKYIGAWAFDNCSGLTSVDIPEGVTKIGNHAKREAVQASR